MLQTSTTAEAHKQPRASIGDSRTNRELFVRARSSACLRRPKLPGVTSPSVTQNPNRPPSLSAEVLRDHHLHLGA
jgi:hypothetical protein